MGLVKYILESMKTKSIRSPSPTLPLMLRFDEVGVVRDRATLPIMICMNKDSRIMRCGILPNDCVEKHRGTVCLNPDILTLAKSSTLDNVNVSMTPRLTYPNEILSL